MLNRNLHDVILNTTTDNKAKQIVLEFKSIMIESKESKRSEFWKIGNEMGMSELWAEPEGFDKDAKYFNPLRKEMQKYPLLEGINSNRVSELDMSAYIDMVENSTKELTNV